jgi:hypothetical protein
MPYVRRKTSKSLKQIVMAPQMGKVELNLSSLLQWYN